MKIGQGNFSNVYKARRVDNKKHYAVKVIQLKEIHKDPEGFQSLYNEINILKEVKHHNIIKLFEVWYSDHSYYLVLEICSKGSLIDRIHMHRRILGKTQQKTDCPLTEFEIYNYIKVSFNILKELK